MSTNSNIGIYNRKKDKVMSIYCHWDGYPEHNGKILLEHYQDIKKIKKLISGGSISSLGEHIDLPEGHSFNTPVENHTVFYFRDSGQNLNIRTSSLEKLHKNEYSYYYDIDEKEWYYKGTNEDYKLLKNFKF